MRRTQSIVVAVLSCLWIGFAVDQASEGSDRGARDAGDEGTPQGRIIELAVGQTHTITLASNPTTGYRWQLASPLNEGILKLVGSEYKKPDSKLLGAGGHELWIFQAVGKGLTSIVMIYVRPWEKDGKAAKTASFSVVVK